MSDSTLKQEISTCPSDSSSKHWYVYLIRTRTSSLYCGITNDLNRRFNQHQTGKGAKYLRGKGPLTLEWSTAVADKSTALKEEIRIKKLSKPQKEALVKG